MATPTTKMTPAEISTLVGVGPYAVVRRVDTMRGDMPTSCALCGSGLCKAVVFTNGAGREFHAGTDCAQWVPGTRRAVAEVKRDLAAARRANKPKPALPKLTPGVHWFQGDVTVVRADGVEFRGRMDAITGVLTLSPDVKVKRVHRSTMDEFDTLILTTVQGL